MTKVVVTGVNGQVARELAHGWGQLEGLELVLGARPAFDLARPETLEDFLDFHAPAIIVNAAAYTAVDLAEDEPQLARTVNALAPAMMARWCAANGARMIQISTDYVYDGSSDRPYLESDGVAPQNVYGHTKLEGEQNIQRVLDQHVILRTAWVYSPYGKNFVKTMLNLAASRQELTVVADQFGNPTAASDIATGIFSILGRWQEEPSHGWNGIYHLAGTGDTHWAGFAEEIMRLSRQAGGPGATIRPISSAAYPTKAKRPANSRLDCSKFEQVWAWRTPNWSNSLAEVILRLQNKQIHTL